jgi:hypothetical protein
MRCWIPECTQKGHWHRKVQRTGNTEQNPVPEQRTNKVCTIFHYIFAHMVEGFVIFKYCNFCHLTTVWHQRRRMLLHHFSVIKNKRPLKMVFHLVRLVQKEFPVLAIPKGSSSDFSHPPFICHCQNLTNYNTKR